MKKLALLKAKGVLKVGMWARTVRDTFAYLVCSSPYHPNALLPTGYAPALPLVCCEGT